MNRENKRKAFEKGYYKTHACSDTFICKVCGRTVVPENAGSGHRNHCPNCLASLHLDIEPGDRESDCGGINYAWPTAEIAVMGASGAVGVLHAKEVAAIENPEERAKFVAEKEQEYNDKFSNPYNAARYGYIDDVIEPRNTRFRIIRALQALSTKRLQNPPKKHSNIPL